MLSFLFAPMCRQCSTAESSIFELPRLAYRLQLRIRAVIESLLPTMLCSDASFKVLHNASKLIMSVLECVYIYTYIAYYA